MAAKRKHKPIHPGEVLRHDFLEPMGLEVRRAQLAGQSRRAGRSGCGACGLEELDGHAQVAVMPLLGRSVEDVSEIVGARGHTPAGNQNQHEPDQLCFHGLPRPMLLICPPLSLSAPGRSRTATHILCHLIVATKRMPCCADSKRQAVAAATQQALRPITSRDAGKPCRGVPHNPLRPGAADHEVPPLLAREGWEGVCHHPAS